MNRVLTFLYAGLLAAGTCWSAESLKPADVKIFGALDYGSTSDAVEYTGTPKFGAFVFNGVVKDRVEVMVESDKGQAIVSIADGSLKELARGKTKLLFTLPNHGPDPETYYILFRELEGRPATFKVSIKKAPAPDTATSHATVVAGSIRVSR